MATVGDHGLLHRSVNCHTDGTNRWLVLLHPSHQSVLLDINLEPVQLLWVREQHLPLGEPHKFDLGVWSFGLVWKVDLQKSFVHMHSPLTNPLILTPLQASLFFSRKQKSLMLIDLKS